MTGSGRREVTNEASDHFGGLEIRMQNEGDKWPCEESDRRDREAAREA